MGSGSAWPVSEDDCWTWFCVSVARQCDDHNVFHFRLPAQSGLEIVGIDVHAGWGDDDILLSSLEVEAAFSIEFADIAGAIPAVFAGDGMKIVSIPVAGGDSASADQDFSVESQFDFASGEDLANRAFAEAKRVVHAY